MVPLVQLLYLRQRDGDALSIIRSFYASFPISLVLIGSVVLQTLPFADSRAAALWALGLGLMAIASHYLEPRIERPLRCASDIDLAGDFRARAFLRIAFANSIALFGFCAAFLTNSSWVFLAGLLFSIPGLVRAAPTRAALAREQAQLTADGCHRSLVAALRHLRQE